MRHQGFLYFNFTKQVLNLALFIVCVLQISIAKDLETDLRIEQKVTTEPKLDQETNEEKITDLDQLRALADAELESGDRKHGYLLKFFDQWSLSGGDPFEMLDLFESDYAQLAEDKKFYLDTSSIRIVFVINFLKRKLFDEALKQEQLVHKTLSKYKVNTHYLARYADYHLLYSIYRYSIYRSFSKVWKGELRLDARKRELTYLVLAKEEAYKANRKDLALSNLISMMGIYIEEKRYDQLERYYTEIKPLADQSDKTYVAGFMESYEKLIMEYNSIKLKGDKK